MKWKFGDPTPEVCGVYLLADFQPLDTIMGCDLQYVFHGVVTQITEAEFVKGKNNAKEYDYYYKIRKGSFVLGYFHMLMYGRPMISPDGIPVFSHYTELEYPKEDFYERI